MQCMGVLSICVVVLLSGWCCAMATASTYDDDFNITRNGLCSKGKDLVDKCVVKKLNCKLTEQQQKAGTILFKICQDKSFQKEYESLMDCLSGFYQVAQATVCHIKSKLTEVMSTETDCVSPRLETFVTCGHEVCSNWSSVIDTVKIGVNSTCSVELSKFSYDGSSGKSHSSGNHFVSASNIIVIISCLLIGRFYISNE